MASDKQIAANRANAKKSTGPRTPSGQGISSMNALKTGIYAKHLLLKDEDPKELHRLRLALEAEWRPVGPTEQNQVERLVGLFWRQRRIYRAETGLYEMYRQCPEGVGGVATALAREGKETEAFTRSLRIDSATERSIHLTIRTLQKLQAERELRAGLADPPQKDESITPEGT